MGGKEEEEERDHLAYYPQKEEVDDDDACLKVVPSLKIATARITFVLRSMINIYKNCYLLKCFLSSNPLLALEPKKHGVLFQISYPFLT